MQHTRRGGELLDTAHPRGEAIVIVSAEESGRELNANKGVVVAEDEISRDTGDGTNALVQWGNAYHMAAVNALSVRRALLMRAEKEEETRLLIATEAAAAAAALRLEATRAEEARRLEADRFLAMFVDAAEATHMRNTAAAAAVERKRAAEALAASAAKKANEKEKEEKEKEAQRDFERFLTIVQGEAEAAHMRWTAEAISEAIRRAAEEEESHRRIAATDLFTSIVDRAALSIAERKRRSQKAAAAEAIHTTAASTARAKEEADEAALVAAAEAAAAEAEALEAEFEASGGLEAFDEAAWLVGPHLSGALWEDKSAYIPSASPLDEAPSLHPSDDTDGGMSASSAPPQRIPTQDPANPYFKLDCREQRPKFLHPFTLPAWGGPDVVVTAYVLTAEDADYEASAAAARALREAKAARLYSRYAEASRAEAEGAADAAEAALVAAGDRLRRTERRLQRMASASAAEPKKRMGKGAEESKAGEGNDAEGESSPLALGTALRGAQAAHGAAVSAQSAARRFLAMFTAHARAAARDAAKADLKAGVDTTAMVIEAPQTLEEAEERALAAASAAATADSSGNSSEEEAAMDRNGGLSGHTSADGQKKRRRKQLPPEPPAARTGLGHTVRITFCPHSGFGRGLAKLLNAINQTATSPTPTADGFGPALPFSLPSLFVPSAAATKFSNGAGEAVELWAAVIRELPRATVTAVPFVARRSGNEDGDDADDGEGPNTRRGGWWSSHWRQHAYLGLPFSMALVLFARLCLALFRSQSGAKWHDEKEACSIVSPAQRQCRVLHVAKAIDRFALLIFLLGAAMTAIGAASEVSGAFEVTLNGRLVYSRLRVGGALPDPSQLAGLIAARVRPKSGH